MKRIILAIAAITLFSLLILLTAHMNEMNSTIPERFFCTMGILSFPILGLKLFNKKSLSKGSRNSVNLTDIFPIGMPVVTTDEYYGGKGYHAFVIKIDKADIGRPLKIQMAGNTGTDWVSTDEIIPDHERGENQ